VTDEVAEASKPDELSTAVGVRRVEGGDERVAIDDGDVV
jgi:hypothetical protein